jgi:hypothetical protein
MLTDDVVRTLAGEFAQLVTLPSDDPNDMVARNGDDGVYALLIRIFPGVSMQWILDCLVVRICHNTTNQPISSFCANQLPICYENI